MTASADRLKLCFVDENGDEESEEPPRPEIREVKEDDAFYSKKYVTATSRQRYSNVTATFL